MLVHFDWKTEYDPFRWTLEYCDPCQQVGPATVEHVWEVCYLYGLVAVGERWVGKISRCDFCRRQIKQPSGRRGIPLEEWRRREGVGVLATKLGLQQPAPFEITDARIYSLLRAVDRASAVDRQELTPIGLVAGGVLGLVAAIPLAMWLHNNQVIWPQIDQGGVVGGAVFVGLVVGIVVGPIVEYFLRRGPGVYARLAKAHKGYGIDLDRLKEASQGFSRRTRKAVGKLYAKVHLRDG